jgi:hypothetical protein
MRLRVSGAITIRFASVSAPKSTGEKRSLGELLRVIAVPFGNQVAR